MYFTVVGILQDGSEGSITSKVKAESPEDAAIRVLLQIKAGMGDIPVRIFAVFEGAHENQIEDDIMSEDLETVDAES